MINCIYDDGLLFDGNAWVDDIKRHFGHDRDEQFKSNEFHVIFVDVK